MLGIVKAGASKLRKSARDGLGLELDVLVFRGEGAIRKLMQRRESSSSDSLKVLAFANKVTPDSRGGAEISLFETLQYLASRGHRISALTSPKSQSGNFKGVSVSILEGARQAEQAFGAADIVITQLGWSADAAKFAMRFGKPWVHLIRDVGEVPRRGRPDLLVFNSETARASAAWKGASAVLHPPVFPDRYATERGEEILLVNLSEFKGARVFYELANRLPRHGFIGLPGGWGDQIIPDMMPSNVEILEATADMRSVYARARLVLMPSVNESFGRVAIEAACSGIPTIAAPVPGLREALGDGGIFVEREDINGWVRAIQALDDPSAYSVASQHAMSRAELFAAERELATFESALRGLCAS